MYPTTDGTTALNGFPKMPINKQKLLTYFLAAIAQGVQYGMGSKDPELGAYPPDFSHIDCSGEVRTLLFGASDGQVNLPDGSWNILDYLNKNGLKKSSFDDTANLDQVLRVCVYEETGKTGHVWLTFMGFTMESHGSAGTMPRKWDHPTLVGISKNTTVFEVA